MEIITKTEGNKATMEISGWLDTQTAPQLGEALSGLEDSITSLVFDFTNLEYISSAGLRQAEMKERAKKTAKKWLKRMDLRSSMFLMRFTMYSALQGLTARSIFRRSNC